MKKIQNVIQTLFQLETQIKFEIDTMNKVFENGDILNEIKLDGFFANQVSFRDSLNTIISNYTIIPFCSFLEEYNKFFTPSYAEQEFSERIKYVKKQNKPGIKRINEWKDLIEYRNVLVAHNFRKKNESVFSTDFKNYSYKIPNTNSEKNLFYGIIHLICLNIRDEFLDVVLTINPKYIMTNQLNIIGEKVDSNKELNELLRLMR